MTFDRFDEVQPPDQWDDIAARAAGPSGPGFEPGGHRMAILVAVAAAVLGLAGVLWVGLGDGDDLATVGTPADTVPENARPETTAPPTTVPPATIEVTQPPVTTAPAATVAETAPPPTSAPPTTVPNDAAFECTETAGDPNVVYENDPAIERFGPLGKAPALDITTGSPEFLIESTDVMRVNGGTAIVLRPRLDEHLAWMLAVVNDDGTLRWRRCGSETQIFGMFATARHLVVGEIDPSPETYPAPTPRHLLDLSTGADAGTLEVPQEMQTLSAEANRYRLFGLPQPRNERGEPQPGVPDAKLRVLDTTTMTVSDVLYPPDYYSGERYADRIQLVETTDAPNGWILKQFGDEYPLVASVFVDGVWSTDPAVIRNLVHVAAVSPYGLGGEWSGVDPLGEPVWTVPDRVAFWTEGPEWREDGDIDMLSVCQRYEPIADGGSMCVSPSLLGVDGESGTILWELPGHRQVQAVGDGYALIGDEHENLYDGTPPGAWLLIDTSTGQPIDGQVWNYEAFETDYYSMEQINKWVRRDGAAVLAVNGDHVRVWMPSATSTGTISVSLPA